MFVLSFSFGIICKCEIGHGMLELKPNLVDFVIQLSCTLAIFKFALESHGWFMNFGVFR